MSTPRTILNSTPTFGRYSAESRERLREYGCEFVELTREEAADPSVRDEYLSELSAWIVGYVEIGREVFEQASNLEIVAKHGTGVDNIDLEAAEEHGVVVANAPGANANAVAELVVLHMLNHARDLTGADATVRNREWGAEMGTEISEKTLGIVGLGGIGQTVVQRTESFGMDYVAYDVDDRPEFQERYDVTMYDDLSEVLHRADFVTVHVPLNEHTEHLIGRDELEAMRSTACLINTARGGIVDEEALLWALRNDEIGGAAIDVFEEEPPTDADRYDSLFADDRVTVSPHIGGKTEEAMGKISDVTTQNVLNVFEDEEPLYRVV